MLIGDHQGAAQLMKRVREYERAYLRHNVSEAEAKEMLDRRSLTLKENKYPAFCEKRLYWKGCVLKPDILLKQNIDYISAYYYAHIHVGLVVNYTHSWHEHQL